MSHSIFVIFEDRDFTNVSIVVKHSNLIMMKIYYFKIRQDNLNLRLIIFVTNSK